MKLEREQALGAQAYERTDSRRGYANGYKPKTLDTRAGRVTVQVPKTRGIEFYPAALEKGVRSERALKVAIAEMYFKGVSTRKVTDVMRELCGLDVSSSQVSRAAKELDEELEAWRTRKIGQVTYLIVDARYEKVRHGGTVVDCAILTAIGVLPDGTRTVLGTSCSLSEAEVHWRSFLGSLIERGMRGVRFFVSDDHAGIRAARNALFPGVPWQRCQFHLAQNAMAYVPRMNMRREVGEDIRTIFNAGDREEADRRLAIGRQYGHAQSDSSINLRQARARREMTNRPRPSRTDETELEQDRSPRQACSARVAAGAGNAEARRPPGSLVKQAAPRRRPVARGACPA
jgi:transposase-like protein